LKVLNLSEVLPVYLVYRVYLSVVVTYSNKYCIFGRVQGLYQINWYMLKMCCSATEFAILAQGILKNLHIH